MKHKIGAERTSTFFYGEVFLKMWDPKSTKQFNFTDCDFREYTELCTMSYLHSVFHQLSVSANEHSLPSFGFNWMFKSTYYLLVLRYFQFRNSPLTFIQDGLLKEISIWLSNLYTFLFPTLYLMDFWRKLRLKYTTACLL